MTPLQPPEDSTPSSGLISPYPSRSDENVKFVISTPGLSDVLIDILVCSVKRYFAIHSAAERLRWIGDYRVTGETSDTSKVWILDHFSDQARRFPCVIITLGNIYETAGGLGRVMTLAQDEKYKDIDNIAEYGVRGGKATATISFDCCSLASKQICERLSSIVWHGIASRVRREDTITSSARMFGLILNEHQINIGEMTVEDFHKGEKLYRRSIAVDVWYTWEDMDWIDFYNTVIEYENNKYLAKKINEYIYYVRLIEEDELLEVDDELKEIIIGIYKEQLKEGTLRPVIVQTIKLASEMLE